MSRGRKLTGVAGGITLAVIAGYLAADVADVAPGLLTRAPRVAAVGSPSPGPATSAASPTASPTGSATPSPTGSPTGSSTPPYPVSPSPSLALPLTALPSSGPGVPAERVRRVVASRAAVKELGGRVGVVVADATTGTTLYAARATTPMVPASTTKLLAAAAVAGAADLSTRFVTRVVAGARTGDVVLVAGGDTLLAPGHGDPTAVAGRAGLADLVTSVAEAVRRSATPAVRVLVDDAAARGPAYAPGWEKDDISRGLTGPVAMLGLTSQRADGAVTPAADAALATARVFRTRLAAALVGVRVAGRPVTVAVAVTRTAAPVAAGANVLGSVSSAPLGEVLGYALEHSDNPLTESLARYAAAGDGAGTSFAAVSAWIRRSVAALGVPVDGLKLLDASGLTRANAVPPRVLSGVLLAAVRGRSPGLSRVVEDLPVGGVSGTLRWRFLDAATHAAAGRVRGKTGTLTGVCTLAGTVLRKDGHLLVYAVMADRVPTGGTAKARQSLDALVAALVG